MLYGDYREKLNIKHFWELKGHWIPWNFDLIKVKLTHRKVNLSSETLPISLYDNCQKINWDYFCLIFVVIDWRQLSWFKPRSGQGVVFFRKTLNFHKAFVHLRVLLGCSKTPENPEKMWDGVSVAAQGAISWSERWPCNLSK